MFFSEGLSDSCNLPFARMAEACTKSLSARLTHLSKAGLAMMASMKSSINLAVLGGLRVTTSSSGAADAYADSGQGCNGDSHAWGRGSNGAADLP